MKRLFILAGAVVLSLSPLHAKTHWKTEKRYSIFYKQPAYVQGFNDGYDGLQYCNSYHRYEDQVLYDMGYEDGDIAYLEDNLRYRSRRNCF